ncbi:hypothetical protein SDC9_85776 [bioreactor metagenome]|uniref:Uncharacterized protein n=1 Tax=bioreactor metagenome TaxID=1076179 RepID=A0A644ZKE4_9ZZZZ
MAHHVRHQRHASRAHLSLCAQQFGARRQLRGFMRPEQPQVPGHVDAGVEVRVHGSHVLQRADGAHRFGSMRRISHALQQTLLPEPPQRLRQIEVLRQRLLHQRVKLRIIPALPPGLQIGNAQRLRAWHCFGLLQPLRRRCAIQRRLGRRHAPAQQRK